MLPMTKKENLNFDLPEDIILKILCCLPIKSLIRFSCVSKRWRTIIISDPQFAKSHIKLASEQRTISRRLLIPSIFPTGCIKFSKPIPGLPSRFQSLENLFGDINSSVTNLTFPSKEHDTDVMASCNGLVIVGSFCKVLSIWNPSTGFFRTIPDPDFSSVTKKKRTVLRKKNCKFWWTTEVNSGEYGFGYDSSTDDYKLVLVVPTDMTDDDSGSAPDEIDIFIFSVRANSWKIIEVSCWPFLRYSPTSHYGTFSNEAIHWVNYDDRLNHICAFDLANEKFRKVPGPCLNQDDHESVLRRTETVVHSGGCLCLWSSLYHEFENRKGVEIEMWMMRDYGVSKSWMKLFKFSEDDLPHVFVPGCGWDLSFVTESGVIFVIELLDKQELVRIECRKEEKPVCSGRYRLEEAPGCEVLLKATVYDETLVSVSE